MSTDGQENNGKKCAPIHVWNFKSFCTVLCVKIILFYTYIILSTFYRRYIAEILPIRRKTLSNQSIFILLFFYIENSIRAPS